MVYAISQLLLFVLIILLPKRNEKINLIKTITIEIICIISYNTFICYILNFINIPITLNSLAIVNFIIDSLLICKIIKEKKLQRYYIEKKELLVIILVFIISIITAGLNSQWFSKIHYISMDSFQHYKAAEEFFENETLSNKYNNNYTTFRVFMPLNYTNEGILFKLFNQIFGIVLLYKIYIIFETFIYFLSGVTFYFCLQKYMKNKNQYIIGIIFSIIYLIAYPLNALISGFHYLVTGIMYFTTILYVIKDIITPNKIHFELNLLILTLLNIGTVFSYSLFCPVIYIAEFIFFIYKYRNEKNKKELLFYIIVPLIFTILVVFEHLLLPQIKQKGTTGIGIDGWIYKNDWSNFILFLPFSIYYVVKLYKDRSKDTFYERVLILIFLIYLIVLAVGRKIRLCSNYYFYKNSFILWLLLLYTSILGMFELLQKKGIRVYIVNIFTIIYTMLLIISMFFIKTYIVLEGNPKEDYTTLMDIFSTNATNITIDYSYLSKEEIVLLERLNNILENNWNEELNSILIVANPTQEMWMHALTGYYKGEYNYKNIVENIKEWNNGKYEYLIVLTNRDNYNTLKSIIKTENAEIIYKNDSGKIYHRNGEK